MPTPDPTPLGGPVADPLSEPGPWLERQLLAQLNRSIDAGNEDRRALLVEIRMHEKNADARHKVTLQHLGKATRDRGNGPGARLAAFVADSPVVKASAANAVVLVIAWAVWRLTGQNPQPIPVYVDPPAQAEATAGVDVP